MSGHTAPKSHKQSKVKPSLYLSPEQRVHQSMKRRKQIIAEESKQSAALIQMLGQEGAEHAVHIVSLKNRHECTTRGHLKLTVCDKDAVHSLL